MKQKYIIIDLRNIAETEKEVNRLIEEGYKPLGGVCVSLVTRDDGSIDSWYAQAMIRETHEDNSKVEELKNLLNDAPVGVVTSGERVNSWLQKRKTLLKEIETL